MNWDVNGHSTGAGVADVRTILSSLQWQCKTDRAPSHSLFRSFLLVRMMKKAWPDPACLLDLSLRCWPVSVWVY